MGEQPVGVVAIFMDNDFEMQGYGGFSLREAQERRARNKLAVAFVRGFGGPHFERGLDAYSAGELVQRLINNHSYKMTFVPIGHAEGD